ncbi:MAG: accessory gene regulator B family protein [Lachnospiraceae bacterium]|nr:accessory gene regulator B family protein [Lachnospiraceae bacterium]
MIEKMAIKIVNQMEIEKIISQSSCEYYEYALIGMLEHAITVGTMLLLGLIFRQFLSSFCFIVFFLSLRKRTGGFHANKFWQCYLGTVIIYIVIMQVVPMFCINQTIMYGTLFLAIILICIIGTINHPNIEMSKSELQESKKAARLVVLMEVMIISVLVYLKADILYIGYMSAAIILCAFLMCLAKIIKQEVGVK